MYFTISSLVFLKKFQSRMGQVMNMIPGLSQMMPKGSDQQSEDRIRRCMTIMDSMNDEELDATDLKIFTDSRIVRIARGSGTHPVHVQELFAMFKPFKDVLDKMSAMTGKGGKGLRGGPPNMKQLQNMINPQMLQQMGGPGALQNMMKQMQSMGLGGGKNFDPSKIDMSKFDMSKLFGGMKM
jgi:signal recognition particle subunit SRP54